jgi:hypothetical protein
MMFHALGIVIIGIAVIFVVEGYLFVMQCARDDDPRERLRNKDNRP